MDQVKVFGRDWCEDTQATRHHLDSFGTPYQYINIEQDPAASQWVKEQNGGKLRTPTVDIRGKILVEPSERELEGVLREQGLRS